MVKIMAKASEPQYFGVVVTYEIQTPDGRQMQTNHIIESIPHRDSREVSKYLLDKLTAKLLDDVYGAKEKP